MQIHSSTFLITGGASGLGAACARRLASAGANIVIADLNDSEGAALAEELGPTARFIRTDVTSPADAQAAVDLALREFGDLHGLVQCAGVLAAARIIGKDGPHDLAQFERVVRVNLIGSFNMLRLAAVAMSAGAADRDGQRGVIVNTASIAAFEGQVGQAAYAASKGGVASLTLPAARELSRFGIRVVAIAPGVFETAMMSGATDEFRQSLTDQIPFPSRWGQPSEFAHLVQSIIENPYLNATIIRLDAGLRLPMK
jgi:NAD(P)-dependent dehydrogenase (short-subunit alcohol dehydrogenase family)